MKNLRDSLERLFWTEVVIAGTGLVTVQATDVSLPAGNALIALGVGALLQAITLVARTRLASLPDPGAGLPGLPTDA